MHKKGESIVQCSERVQPDADLGPVRVRQALPANQNAVVWVG